MQNEMFYVDMSTSTKPFDNKLVRQAVAYAIPYNAIMSQALYARGEPMFGADPKAPFAPKWPVASPYQTDLDKAKELLKQAGYPDGFKTEMFIDMSQSTIQEPMALLIQEQLKKIGIDMTLTKVPGSEWFRPHGFEEAADGHQLFLRLAGLSRVLSTSGPTTGRTTACSTPRTMSTPRWTS